MQLNILSLKSSVKQEIFDKGLEIYLKGNVNYDNLNIIDLGNEKKYTYPISYENASYSVVVKVSEKDKDYFLSGCLCKCFYCHNNKAICEHIVALCLIIMDYLNYGNENINELSNEFYKKDKEDNLMKLFKGNEFSNIKLRPNFIIENNKVFLRLNIMNDKEYIISSISQFLDAIEKNTIIKYGKKLEFVHSINAFEKKSRELIELLMISKIDIINKNLFVNSFLFDKITTIYKNDVVSFTINNNTYKINNKLEEINLNIFVDLKEISLDMPKNIFYIKCFNKLILLNKDCSNVIYLNQYEMNFVESLLTNKINFMEVEEFFFSKVYPKIKRIVTLTDETEKQFPVYDVTINSYFDFSNSSIELRTEILEDGNEVLKDNLAVLSKVIYFEYEELLREFNFNINNYLINDSLYVVDFLHADLSKFKEYGQVYLSEKIKKTNIKRTGKFSLGVNYNLNLLELNIDSKMSNEELEVILNAYRNKEKYVVLKNNVIIEIDDDVKELSRIVEEYALDESDLTTPKLKPSYTILNLLKEDNIDKKESIEVLEDFANFQNNEIYPIEKINNVLRPYQLDAFRWLSTITKYGFGGLLADDMGLGKTLEILSMILSDDVEKPSIIISPMSLVYNWSNEIAKWGNGIKVNIILGAAKDRLNLLQKIDYNKKEIYLVSYDILKKDIDYIKGLFRFVIIDEAQYIKNKNTKTALSVKKIDSEVRFALTGTPIENSLSDLWSIFDFILPNYLSSYKNFKEEYELLDETSTTLELLQKKVSPFILRRTKKEVLKDLPDKIEEVYYTQLSKPQEDLYNAYLNKARNSLSNNNEIEILSILTRLRQICVSPKMFLSDYNDEEVKIDLTVDLINKAINGDHKILLFSQFTSSFDVLSKKLNELNIKYYTITGKTSAKDRVSLANDFNNKDDVKLFLISLKAGGTGLNLYGADTVIHLDPWWNQSAEAQATDRAHRIGQKKVLNVIKIICANTIEEKVLQLQNFKAELSSKVIDSESKNKRLNIKDLEFLLS